ncbi:MAG TPA: 50S ribosomal protein L29 [Candidatus Kapabacteria bacterium]|jgi:large subunit ribosomal protein L29|nr:50S ribosomal protein L29 [Candidatus Kapabacteria bacterium]HOV92163.1 50S ribosomal protein L29 [Candidatus Kapabacteria bacterium]
MKPHYAKDLKELSDKELTNLYDESKENLMRLRIQNSLKQLNDTASLKIVKKDVARILTIMKERNLSI